MSSSTLRRVSVATILVIAIVASVGATPAQAAPRPAAAPVPDPFDPAPPGAKDWTCRPSAAHPRPVVLVHGIVATMGESWSYLSPIIRQAGYCVFALTYGRRTVLNALDPAHPGDTVVRPTPRAGPRIPLAVTKEQAIR